MHILFFKSHYLRSYLLKISVPPWRIWLYEIKYFLSVSVAGAGGVSKKYNWAAVVIGGGCRS